MVPTTSSAIREAYEAARQRAVVIDRSERGRIVLSGRDRAAYLQGLLTNDIAALAPGRGCYAAYLTPQGRMISQSLWVYELGDVMLILLDRAQKDKVLERLNQFIFSEEVQLGDVTDAFTGVAVVGPEAAAAVEAVLDAPEGGVRALAEHENLRARFRDHAVVVLRVTDTGEPGYELQIERAGGQRLKAALAEAGAAGADGSVAELLRIEAGVPKFHQDMDEDTIPLEAGIESRAISLTKGCYVGQEVIIRVLHRGHGRVARKLVGLTVDGDAAPVPGTTVQAEGRDIGRVTSSAVSFALGRPVALAYVQRDFVAPGTRAFLSGVPAVVTALPFVDRGSQTPSGP